MFEWLRFWITAALLLTGLFFMCAGVFGTYRFRFVLNRMHSAGMIDTMGALGCMLALIVATGWGFTALKILLVLALLWCTSPVSTHLIARLVVNTEDNLSDNMEVREK